MSEYCREQHPLLCEEGSEEDIYSPRFCRKVHPMTFRGRAGINHKGAAAILSRWPEHWSSFLTSWWIAIGMIGLTTFIIFNSLFALSILPSTNTKPANTLVTKEAMNTIGKSTPLPEVYMHVFVESRDDLEVNMYMPYIEQIASTFLDYKFNYIVVVNDTDVGWMSAEENNELALNLLWTRDKYVNQKETRGHNINVEYISLSLFMDNSPLRKFWRTLPHQIIEFLARTVSIWDKGGVAFNPDVLTTRFQHTLYIEKLQTLLNKFAHSNKVIKDLKPQGKTTKPSKKIKKVNNIRDIIEVLEKEDKSANAYGQHNLSEAEGRDNMQLIREERHSVYSTDSNKISSEWGPKQSTHNTNSDPIEFQYNNSKMSLLPLLFLDFLFPNKNVQSTPTESIPAANRTRKSIITPKAEVYNYMNVLEETRNNTESIFKPIVVAAPINYSQPNYNNVTSVLDVQDTEQYPEMNKLTLDLKGNIIATDTACHAFLGTIYSNLVHYNREETVTDFIIAELTIFCKGLLSSCIGIELILL